MGTKIAIPAEGNATPRGPHDVGVLQVSRVTVGASPLADVQVGAIATYAIADVAPGVMIHDVHTRVQTAFTGSVTLTIGDGSSAAGYMTTALIAPQSAVTNLYVGMLQAGSLAYGGGYYYIVADTIDIVVAGAIASAGLLEVLISWTDFSGAGF